MLSVKDIEAIATDRFYEKEGKYADYFATAVMIWTVVVLIVAMASALIVTINAPSVVFLTIPSERIVVGQDICVMYKNFQGYTVNGYVLDTGKANSLNPWLWFALATLVIPLIGVSIVQSISDSRKAKYVGGFVQKWANNKEIEPCQ